MAHDVCHSVCECISSQSTGPRRRFLCVLAIKGELEEVREGGGVREREKERGIVRIGEGCGLAEGWGSQRQRNGEREVEGGKTE